VLWKQQAGGEVTICYCCWWWHGWGCCGTCTPWCFVSGNNCALL